MVVLSTALIPLSTVALLVRRSALVVAWVEVLVEAMVYVIATTVTRVKIAP